MLAAHVFAARDTCDPSPQRAQGQGIRHISFSALVEDVSNSDVLPEQIMGSRVGRLRPESDSLVLFIDRTAHRCTADHLYRDNKLWQPWECLGLLFVLTPTGNFVW